MEKRGAGHLPFVVIIELTLGMIVLVLLNVMAKDFAGGVAFGAEYYAEDLARYAEAVQAVPGNLVIRYPNDLGDDIRKYGVTFADTRVEVYKQESVAGVPTQVLGSVQHFASSRGAKFHNTYLNQPELYFYSTEGEVGVSAYPAYPGLMDCRPFNFAKETKAVLIDAGHGESPDSGAVSISDPSFKESAQTCMLAQQMAGELTTFRTYLTRDSSCLRHDEPSIALSQAASGVVLSLHSGTDDHSLKAFIPLDDSGGSARLACKLINAVLKTDLGITQASIIPVDAKYEAASFSLLKRTSVLLEIGGLSGASSPLSKTDELSKALKLGLEEYYEVT